MKNNRAGAGIHSSLFSFYLSLGPNSTHFDGELEAISLALKQLIYHHNAFKNAAILINSKSAIQAITGSNPASRRVSEIQESIKHLHNLQNKIVLQWISSHCDIQGNEQADFLSKKGTKIQQTSRNKIPFQSSKIIINKAIQQNVKKELHRKIENKKWKPLLTQKTLCRTAPE